MANVDYRFGLVPVKMKNGSAVGESNAYYVPASYATALFVGDPVVMTGTSNTTEIKGYAPGALKEVTLATAGATNQITGAITSVSIPLSATDISGNVYRPASTEAVVMVQDSKEALFEVQADGVVEATDIGSNADLIYTHPGEPVYGKSGAELDTSAMTASATGQLRIEELVNRLGNSLGEHAKLLVSINLHTSGNATTGA